jgi:hypothetical protein
MTEPLLFLLFGFGVVITAIFFFGGIYESHRV